MTYLEYLLLVRELFLQYSALPEFGSFGLCYINRMACPKVELFTHPAKLQRYIKQQCKGNVWVTDNLPLNETQTASEYRERCKAFRLFLIDYAIGMEKQQSSS